jgi:hypothetical protein
MLDAVFCNIGYFSLEKFSNYVPQYWVFLLENMVYSASEKSNISPQESSVLALGNIGYFLSGTFSIFPGES